MMFAKIYGSAPSGNWRGAIARLVDDAAGWLAAAPYEFSINYGEPRKFGSASLSGAIAAFDQLDYLDLLSKRQGDGLFVTTPFSRGLSTPLYECCFFHPLADSELFFLDAVRLAARHLKVVYGYGRELPPHAHALSETVPRRTFFGNSVLKTDPKIHVWKAGPTDDGGLKGIYRFNLVPRSLLVTDALLGPILGGLPQARVTSVDEELAAITLSAADLEGVRKHAPGMKDFVRV